MAHVQIKKKTCPKIEAVRISLVARPAVIPSTRSLSLLLCKEFRDFFSNSLLLKILLHFLHWKTLVHRPKCITIPIHRNHIETAGTWTMQIYKRCIGPNAKTKKNRSIDTYITTRYFYCLIFRKVLERNWIALAFPIVNVANFVMLKRVPIVLLFRATW